MREGNRLFDLQLFAEETENGGGADISAQESSGEPSQPQLHELDFGGRRVAVSDPGLHEDWLHQTRRLQELQEEIRRRDQLLQQYDERLKTLQPPQPQPSPEEIQRRNEELYQRILEDPVGVFDEWERRIIARLEAHEQREAVLREAEQLEIEFPDFEALAPEMNKVLDELAAANIPPPNLRTVYHIAKGRTASPPPQPDQLLQDPEIRKRILSDPSIREEILKSHAQALHQQQAGLPTLITNQTGSPPMTPEEQPKTLREATRAAIRFWGQG